MPSPLAMLNDQRVVHLRTRLVAWWEGKEPVQPAPLMLTQTADAAEQDEKSPRSEALARLWGEGCSAPMEVGQEADWLSALAAKSDEALAVLSPLGARQLQTLTAQRKGRIEIYEWRDNHFSPLERGAAALNGTACKVHPMGVDGTGLKGRYGGLVSCEELAYCPDVAVFLKHVQKAIKAGAGAVFETYCTEAMDANWNGAFSVAEPEPKIRNLLALRAALTKAGFTILSEEDRSRVLARSARAAFSRFSSEMRENPIELSPAALQELAYESESWSVRLKLLGNGMLKRHRFVTVKAKVSSPPLGSIFQARTAVAAR